MSIKLKRVNLVDFFYPIYYRFIYIVGNGWVNLSNFVKSTFQWDMVQIGFSIGSNILDQVNVVFAGVVCGW